MLGYSGAALIQPNLIRITDLYNVYICDPICLDTWRTSVYTKYSLVWRTAIESAYNSAPENHRACTKPSMQQSPTHVVDHAKLLAFSRERGLCSAPPTLPWSFSPCPCLRQNSSYFMPHFGSFSVSLFAWADLLVDLHLTQSSRPSQSTNKTKCTASF